MKKHLTAIPDSATKNLFTFWKGCIDGFESANTIFLPKSDRYYRVAQFIQEYTPQYKSKKIIRQLNIQSLNCEPAFFKDKIESLRPSPGVDQVFFVMDGEWVIENNPQFFEQMRHLSYQPEPKDTFIITYETDPYIIDFENITLSNQILCKNILRVPLYSQEDISHFIHYFSNLLNVTLSKSQTELIQDLCGGYIGLTSEIIRNYKLSGEFSYRHTTMQLKLRSIWNSLPNFYQRVLSALANNNTYSPDLNSIAETMITHKLIVINQGKLKISVPLLEHYILKISKKTINFTSDNRMEINGVVLDKFTNRDIQILKTLINSKDTVTREQIAQRIWMNYTDYNDWTLDQTIKRLRDKLKKSGLNPKSLKTIKNKGYRWEE